MRRRTKTLLIILFAAWTLCALPAFAETYEESPIESATSVIEMIDRGGAEETSRERIPLTAWSKDGQSERWFIQPIDKNGARAFVSIDALTLVVPARLSTTELVQMRALLTMLAQTPKPLAVELVMYSRPPSAENDEALLDPSVFNVSTIEYYGVLKLCEMVAMGDLMLTSPALDESGLGPRLAAHAERVMHHAKARQSTRYVHLTRKNSLKEIAEKLLPVADSSTAVILLNDRGHAVDAFTAHLSDSARAHYTLLNARFDVDPGDVIEAPLVTRHSIASVKGVATSEQLTAIIFRRYLVIDKPGSSCSLSSPRLLGKNSSGGFFEALFAWYMLGAFAIAGGIFLYLQKRPRR